MGLGRIFNRAKEIVSRRGGTESVKQDAAELKDIASGPGSLTDKAKAAGEALKEPGSRGAEPSEQERARGGAKPEERPSEN